ncbi:MAG: O-methyltransferase [Bacteroidetes bacterium]|nr:O-methyltransferase [Bacteroidota bacterium]MCB9225694.1 O-methyltransferase [Chitinophagales bacterium]
MRFLPEEIENYAALHSLKEDEVLQQLNRETHLNILMPQMISGHIQGNFLRMMSFMIKPKNILEIGTFTGYSAICLAQGLQENGKLYTIDINEELEDMCRTYFDKAGLKNKIDYRIGNALDIIPDINETFDLVFIDADKINYSNYYDLVFSKVNKGGFILADNVLWSGKVTQEKKNKDTQALHDYNTKITNDERVENYLVPIRDGIMVARKK